MRLETTTLDARELRHAGALMLGAALLLPALPGHPGLACPLRTLTGIPCPLCGMTTSVEDSAHGHLVQALSANPGGIAAVAGALYLLARRPVRVVVSGALMAGVLTGMWLFELHRFGIV